MTPAFATLRRGSSRGGAAGEVDGAEERETGENAR
jgi:hypothetical protein